MNKLYHSLTRFFQFVEYQNDCWVWNGGIKGDGYGSMYFNGKCIGAHRVSFYFFNGYFPRLPEMVCHTCDNPLCVNPKHLFTGTQYDNMSDMVNKGRGNMQKKTHCSNGHEYTVKNTRLRLRKRTGRYFRDCMICVRANDRKNYWKNKK